MVHFGKGPIRRSCYRHRGCRRCFSATRGNGFLIDRERSRAILSFNSAVVVDLSSPWCLHTGHDHRHPGRHHRLVFPLPGKRWQLGWLPGVAIPTNVRTESRPDLCARSQLAADDSDIATTVACGSRIALRAPTARRVHPPCCYARFWLDPGLRDVWRWPIAAALASPGLLVVDGSFFLANL